MAALKQSAVSLLFGHKLNSSNPLDLATSKLEKRSFLHKCLQKCLAYHAIAGRIQVQPPFLQNSVRFYIIKAIDGLNGFAYEDGGPESWGNVLEKSKEFGCDELASQKLLNALTKIYSPDDYGSPIYDLIALSHVYNRAGIPIGTKEQEILRKILHTEIPLKNIL